MPESDVDLTTLGLNFSYVEKPEATVEETEIKQALIVLEDERTNDDIRAEALSLISNALDLPVEVIDQARLLLTSRSGELRDYVMNTVVPVVLSINPAMNSVQQMVPRLFENGEDTEIEVPIQPLINFAEATGILATKLKIIDMMGLPADARDRLLARLVPMDKPAQPVREK